jgi:hypothetical protein
MASGCVVAAVYSWPQPGFGTAFAPSIPANVPMPGKPSSPLGLSRQSAVGRQLRNSATLATDPASEAPMHVCRLIELAGLLVWHGPTLICNGEAIPSDSIEQYWTTSKVRLDRWAWSLKRLSKHDASDAASAQDTPNAVSLLEEILASEMLTRVWTAVACVHDRQRGQQDIEPVARSIMLGQMEMRHRVLTLMVRGPVLNAEAAVRLNRFRRRTEHWTDLLIGHLVPLYNVSEFAPDPQRAQEFANDLQQRGSLARGRRAWSLTLTSLRTAFQVGLSEISPNGDLNARIAGSILSCFPPETFDSTGLFRSLWLMRLTAMADETQGMIEDILTDTAPRTDDPNVTTDRRHRLRRFGA